jgi:uncharacterized protein YndB with AHSA1/START domain
VIIHRKGIAGWMAQLSSGAMAQTYSASTSVDIDASPTTVWNALTDPASIARYMHGTSVDTDWSEGSSIFWRGEWEGKDYEDKGEVVTFDPPQRLAVTHWSPLTGEPDVPENYHHVRYDVEAIGEGRTRLTLTHGNSPTQEAADTMIENGWRPTLEAIKQLLEEPS